MYCGTPVIAVNSGGPIETVVDNVTGYLCPANPDAFAVAMTTLAKDEHLAKQLGTSGKKRVEDLFTLDTFGQRLEEQMYQAFRRQDEYRVRRYSYHATMTIMSLVALLTSVIGAVWYKLFNLISQYCTGSTAA